MFTFVSLATVNTQCWIKSIQKFYGNFFKLKIYSKPHYWLEVNLFKAWFCDEMKMTNSYSTKIGLFTQTKCDVKDSCFKCMRSNLENESIQFLFSNIVHQVEFNFRINLCLFGTDELFSLFLLVFVRWLQCWFEWLWKWFETLNKNEKLSIYIPDGFILRIKTFKKWRCFLHDKSLLITKKIGILENINWPWSYLRLEII